MKLLSIRCRICLAWRRINVKRNHCPYCGAMPVAHTHYAMTADGTRVRELVSAVHVPLAVRNIYTR